MATVYIKVDKNTRSGKNGKDIYCPICRWHRRVFHFSWDALVCMECKSEVNKNDWYVQSDFKINWE